MSVLDRVRPTYTLQEEVELGREAGRILKSESFKLAMEDAEIGALQKWRESREMSERERQWALVNALEDVHRALRAIQENGEVARANLERRK